MTKAFVALAEGGTVVVADYLPDEARSRAALPLLFAMFVRLTSQGNAYTYGEIARWLTVAGFTELRRGDRLGAFSVVMATKR